jgi:hypothetical protein
MPQETIQIPGSEMTTSAKISSTEMFFSDQSGLDQMNEMAYLKRKFFQLLEVNVK